MLVGDFDGVELGWIDGVSDGPSVGVFDDTAVGSTEGSTEGVSILGEWVGRMDGETFGASVPQKLV